MSRLPYLGDYSDGARAIIDLPRLLETRLLIQSASGFGKSYAVRRLLEQTAGLVQQLVIDPDGEFASLREKYDFVIAAAHDGDALAHPKTAALLARRLLETGVSAILDIYDLKPQERHAFVRLFLQAMVDAPKSLWRPVLVVVDEAHVFAPQVGESEAASAVIDLATRGRKRGFGIVLATQRLAKLHKDAAAECLNKLIGRAGLDVDVRRAGDELGLTHKDAGEKLRKLDPGEFFAYGPALSPDIRQLKVGAVVTTHPKAGQRNLIAPPKPTAAIRAVLPQLADLPKEAEHEARTLDDLKRELAQTRRELTMVKSARSGPSAEELKEAENRGYVHGVAAGSKEMQQRTLKVMKDLHSSIHQAVSVVFGQSAGQLPAPITPVTPRPAVGKPAAPVERPAPSSGALNGNKLTVGQRILNSLAEAEMLGTRAPERVFVAVLSGYGNVKSPGFQKAIGNLFSEGLVVYPEPGLVALTETGGAQARPPSVPSTSEQLQERICGLVGGVATKILRALLDVHPEPMRRQDLAQASGYGNVKSPGFQKTIGRLNSLGFVRYPDPGYVRASPLLFVERDR